MVSSRGSNSHTALARADGDGLSLLESVMCVLLNWCTTWAETFPYPPLSDLGDLASLLEFHDPQLAAHLQACGAGSEAYAWPMLRTLMSEVLSRDEVRGRTCGWGSCMNAAP